MRLPLAHQVTSAVLVAPSSVTHSFNTNQRVVKLVATINTSTQTVQLTVSVSLGEGLVG